MSLLFPTNPATVEIHPLPEKAEMITYKVADDFRLSAWMPDGAETIGADNDRYSINNAFYRQFCRSCPNYHDESPCNVYTNGYVGQPCPEEHSEDDLDLGGGFSVANMVFQVHLNHLGDRPRFVYQRDSAFLCSAEHRNGQIYTSNQYRAANVHGSGESPGEICWGSSVRPKNLREVVNFYFSAPFNNDLLRIESFEDNCRHLRGSSGNNFSDRTLEQLYEICRANGVRGYSRLKKADLISELTRLGLNQRNRHTRLWSNEKFLCGHADGLMILDAEQDQQAFCTMLMAGFKTLPEVPHCMMIPLTSATFMRDGHEYRGYFTPADSVGRQWFISYTNMTFGLLVGQM